MTSESITRRPLRVLRTLYETTPKIRDVIVEGRSDAGFIKWYLGEHGLFAVVHAIDDRADVSSSDVLRYRGEVGARGRVIGFAGQVEGWKLREPTVTCIIDADRTSLLEDPPILPDCLLTTDFGSMDVYMLQHRPFNQFLRLVLGRNEDAEQIVTRILPALNQVCVVRAVLHWSGLGISLVKDFSACCQPSRESIVVDIHELLNRTLSGKDREHYDELVKEVDQTLTRLPSDRLKAVRGHDIAPLVIKELGLKNVWAKEDAFERAWRGCIQASDLDDFPLFSQLRDRVDKSK